MLIAFAPPTLEESVRDRVLARTGRRVRGLQVRVQGKTVVLAGKTSSFHIKQLAQHGVREVLPNAPLTNEIVVEASC